VSAPRQWSTPAAQVPPGGSAKFPIVWRGRRLEGFVINFEGRFHAYVNLCIHAGTPLDWWPNEFFTEDGQLLICATHGALYAPDTGHCAGGPCGGGRLYTLPVRLDGDRIVVITDDGDAGEATETGGAVDAGDAAAPP
jgi:nitrite reductase/ring-hydroxylating ferredoxin subunit